MIRRVYFCYLNRQSSYYLILGISTIFATFICNYLYEDICLLLRTNYTFNQIHDNVIEAPKKN